MTEKDAFEADIREHPDDDAPRLVYADWLDDHGEADRAAFIRAQCAGDADAARPFAGRLREWAGPLPLWCGRYEFHRGFVEVVHAHAAPFVERAEELFQTAPVRLVKFLSLYTGQIAPLAKVPQLARLAVLLAGGTFRQAGFRTLFRSPHLADLAGLAVNDTPIGRAGLSVLLESATPRLTHLDLGKTGIGVEGVSLLSRSPMCQSLVALDLRDNGLTPRALRALDRSPHLGRLRRLGLWYNRLGDEGLAELIRMPLLARLTHLSLGNNRFTARGLRALAESPSLGNLRTLWLGYDRYGAAGVEALTRSPYLHPEARLSFWLNDDVPEERKQGVRDRLGDRVTFDDPGAAWQADPLVGWPLWRPAG